MTRRTSGGNARNGVNSAQCARHSLTIAGYRSPHAAANASSAAAAARLVGGGVDRAQVAG